MEEEDREHPYSVARVAAGLAHVSGSLSVDEAGAVVVGRREALDAALKTLERRLAAVSLGLDDVVKLTYFVTDISLRDCANDQYRQQWTAPRPARTFVGVSQLPYGATVEIDAIAQVGEAR